MQIALMAENAEHDRYLELYLPASLLHYRMVGARLPASMAWGTPPQQHQCTMARLRGAGRVQCMAAACVCAHVMLAIEGVCS
jgi:hypothetical protein